MKKENRKTVFIACILSAAVGIFWSLLSLAKDSRPLFWVFLTVNLLSLMLVVFCLVWDKRFRENGSEPLSVLPEDLSRGEGKTLMTDRERAREVLERFCACPLGTEDEVLRLFSALPGAQAHFDGDKRNFVYVPGKREDRVLLIAHADTVWDLQYRGEDFTQRLQKKISEGKTVYSGVNPSCGIGADDRAGCAILWLLKDLGHSLLITDGEERGQISANHIKNSYPALYDELNAHAYAIQFDRRNATDYKVYDLAVSEEFLAFIEAETGYSDAGRTARTDIVAICRDICGVNLSIGYYAEHTPDECLVLEEWLATLTLAERLLQKPQKRYPLLP